MSKFKISIKTSAIKELRKLQKKDANRVTKIIQELANNPNPHGSIKLKGYKDLWRIRTGNFRIIYSIEYEFLTIHILEIVDRKNAY